MKNLPQNAIAELQAIYQKEFSIQLSEDAAKSEARRLLSFFYQLFLFEQNHLNNTNLSTVPSSQQDKNMLSS